ncbi:GNAT family N-acetyltransferase [Kibdelosporangium phytohabitans]|uniref:Cellulose biosynthesis protein CelD n=1 Tax=Kibdelosporangium phytohabitans TaxID=860235 RepID=A0A0N9ICB6_9PSEU|nr:GNAT family N-acetyltransferase [Kibdelosporangium phytohabitans]ALG14072.1 cellulose biosynthesis protein CelD [Kibdelosporangium phytohabitans]MBE1466957.1 CelD/BcsL family acetyltransferase involved in cellulose biosynthesis [Kibdelosporangium phytohabitans]
MRLVPFGSLTDEDFAAWQAIRASDSRWDSPYFTHEYMAAVHAGRPIDVLIGDGFLWPLHKTGSSARPAGSPGADFQGPIVEPGVRFSPKAVLAAVGVRSLSFDHLVDGYRDLEPWVEERRVSPFMDVTGGLDGYLNRVDKSGRGKMSEARRLTNKANRELGEVRSTVQANDGLDQVVALKREQYASTGAQDHFADQANRDLVRRLMGSDLGLLSTVYAGPHLLAAHFGIRDGGVLHWWFPVFERKFGSYSPGWVLLREVVTAAPELGITRIDLGRGEDEYKRRAMTGSSTVCIGAITSGLGTPARRLRRAAVGAAKSSPIAPQLRAIARKLR